MICPSKSTCLLSMAALCLLEDNSGVVKMYNAIHSTPPASDARGYLPADVYGWILCWDINNPSILPVRSHPSTQLGGNDPFPSIYTHTTRSPDELCSSTPPHPVQPCPATPHSAFTHSAPSIGFTRICPSGPQTLSDAPRPRRARGRGCRRSGKSARTGSSPRRRRWRCRGPAARRGNGSTARSGLCSARLHCRVCFTWLA